MNKKVMLITCLMIVCMSIFGLVTYNLKYRIKKEVIVADNTKEDEERYKEYSSGYSGIVDIYDENNKEITGLRRIMLPRKIVYYHERTPYIFKYGTEEYNKIIELNAKRDTGKTGESHIFFDDTTLYKLIQKIDMLRYCYDESTNLGDRFFNLEIHEIKVKNENYSIGSYWYTDVFCNNIGLEKPDELLEYLNSVIPK